MPVHASFENLVKQFDVALQPYAFSNLVKMLLPHLRFELRIVEQQIGEFRSLLHQVNLGHAFGFAFEFCRRNTDQLR